MAKSKWHTESEKDELGVNSLPSDLREELMRIFPRPNDNREGVCEKHRSDKWHCVFYDGGWKGIIAHYWRCNDCMEEYDNKLKNRKEFKCCGRTDGGKCDVKSS
jgi:hypothetical protein